VVGNGIASVVIARWEGVLEKEGVHHADEINVPEPAD
jgi:hypothetical protein